MPSLGAPIRTARALTAALMASMLLAVGCGPSKKTAEPVDPLMGRSIADLALKTVDGQDVRVRDMIGGKVAIVDYWATWCAPCLAAMPHLDDLNKRYKDRGFTVLGVMIDGNASRIGPNFIRKRNLSYPNLLDDDAAQSEKVIGTVTGIPLLLLVDRDGKVRQVFGGGEDPAEIERAVERAIAQTPTQGAPAA